MNLYKYLNFLKTNVIIINIIRKNTIYERLKKKKSRYGSLSSHKQEKPSILKMALTRFFKLQTKKLHIYLTSK